jgi:hypothetical protein
MNTAEQSENPMMRFFFDVAATTHIRYDYQGRDLGNQEAARELAELIALDLGNSDENDWQGAKVEVRDVKGARLFEVPV